jgi:hypothetical protein
MLTEFDIGPMVEKHSVIPMACLRVLRSVERVDLPEIRRGIIFVFAPWSAPAVVGLQRFTKVIKSIDTHCLDLVVLDIDCLTEHLATQLFGVPSFTTGGWGETIWIRDGRVIARVLAHTASESLIEQHTKELLNGNAA